MAFEFTLFGQTFIFGGFGPDRISAPRDIDTDLYFMFGLGGNDGLTAVENVPGRLFGGAGDDVLVSKNLGDVLDGGSGDDKLDARDVDNDGALDGVRLLGGSGDDQIFDSGGLDEIVGGKGDDAIMLSDDDATDGLLFSRSDTSRGDVDMVTGFGDEDLIALVGFDIDDVEVTFEGVAGQLGVNDAVLRFGGREVVLVDFNDVPDIVIDGLLVQPDVDFV